MTLSFRTVGHALVLTFAIALLIGGSTIALAQSSPVVAVTQPVAKRVTKWEEYSGRFVAIQTVEVRPRVSGFIDKIHFQDGQIVKAGDLLFTIDQRPFEIAVESAKAEIARAQAQVELAENEIERGAPLARSGTMTQKEFDQRRSNLNVARAQLQAAQAGSKSAMLNLEWTEVRAPIAGRASDRRIDIGNLITGGQAGATLLTTIVSIDPIHFVFDVAEVRLPPLFAAVACGRAALVAR